MSGLLSTLRTNNASNFSGGLFTLQQQQRVSNTVLYLKKSDQSSAEFDGKGVPKDSKSGRIRAHVPEGLELKSANLKTIYDAEFNGGLNAITPVYLYSSEPEETFVSGYPTYNSTGRVTQKCDGMHVKEKMNDQGRLEFPKEPMTCGMASGAVARLMGQTNNTGDPDILYVKSIKSVTFQEDHVLVVFKNKTKDLKLNIDEFVTAFSLFGKCGLCGTKLEVKLHLTVGVLPTIEPVTFLSHSPYDYYALQNDLMQIEQLYSRVKSIAPDMDLRLSDVELQLYRVPESHRAVIRWGKNKSVIGNMGETELYVSHISLTPEYQEQFAEIIKLESEVKRKRFAMGIQKAKTLVYGGESPVSEPVLQSAEVYQEALPAAAVNDSVVEDVEVLDPIPEQPPVSVPVVPEEEIDDIPFAPF